MRPAVIALNAGSSSLKLAAFEPDDAGGIRVLMRGQTSIGAAEARLSIRDGENRLVAEQSWPGDRPRGELMRMSLQAFGRRLPAGGIGAVGHRIVHGGPDFSAPAELDDDAVARLRKLVDWAPLHQPLSLELLDLSRQVWPEAVQLGCFDTAFHHDQPAVATRLALPRALEADGVRRYGFHGLSCQWALSRLSVVDPATAAGRVLIAHLGSGASLTAVRAGGSLDSSMGFSPLDGLVMSTRCGSLDPGVILFLEQARGMTADQVEDLLYRRSGLLGVSGLSGDMRTLLASADPAAREAVELFVFRAAREAGALVSSLQGLDGIVFTGGIGENAPLVRSAIATRLAWLGVVLDEGLNQTSGDRLISRDDSRVRVWVLAADEEAVIAEACAKALSGNSRSVG